VFIFFINEHKKVQLRLKKEGMIMLGVTIIDPNPIQSD
jgi:hypothetical protein